MTLQPRSDIEAKLTTTMDTHDRELAICARVAEALNGISIRAVSKSTGYNAETVRRYLRGESKIPADFIGQVYRTHDGIDVYRILGFAPPVPEEILRHIPTHHIINELSHRIRLIEDASIAKIMTQDL